MQSLPFWGCFEMQRPSVLQCAGSVAEALAVRVKEPLVCSKLFHGRGTVVCPAERRPREEGVGDGKG